MTEVVLQLALTTTWKGEGTYQEVHDEAKRLLEDYLTDEEYPLFDDYGRGAWGGYEGPIITKARIREL